MIKQINENTTNLDIFYDHIKSLGTADFNPNRTPTNEQKSQNNCNNYLSKL